MKIFNSIRPLSDKMYDKNVADGQTDIRVYLKKISKMPTYYLSIDHICLKTSFNDDNLGLLIYFCQLF